MTQIVHNLLIIVLLFVLWNFIEVVLYLMINLYYYLTEVAHPFLIVLRSGSGAFRRILSVYYCIVLEVLTFCSPVVLLFLYLVYDVPI